MSSVEIRPVKTKAEMKAFVSLPWKIYQDDPNFIPPLKSEVNKLLDPHKHPFWEFSQRELFMAWRGPEPVGRIAAIIDGNYIEKYNEQMGAFGFFECEASPETAVGLFSAAERWLRERGIEAVRGPLNPSFNYEIGLLIEGFDRPPTLGLTHNPPYYHELTVSCGFRKEKDLLAYRFDRGFTPPSWYDELGQSLAKRAEITIRHVNKKKIESEVKLINAIYNECWAGNWGHVPMTEEEIKDVAKSLVHFLDTDLIFFLFYRDEPVGVSLVLPDINPLLKRFNGKLDMSALVKRFLYWSDVTGLRGYIFGVKEEYRQMGLPLVAYNHLMKAIHKSDKYQYMEVGWNLEDNDAINRLYDEAGAKPSRKFRIYRKDL